MATIVLDENFSILIDTYNFQLNYSNEVAGKDKKTGEEKIIKQSDSWFYPDLGGALKCYLKESLRESESIQEVLNKIDEVHETIKAL